MPRRYRRRSRCAALLSRCGCRRPSRGWSGRMCQRNSVSGVTSRPARLGRGSAAAIASSRLGSVSVSSGRSTCRRSTVSWWRNTMISRSLERPERTVSRASDARNRYKIRYTRNQDRPSSLQVNAHGRVFGTHRHPGPVTAQRMITVTTRQQRLRRSPDRINHLRLQRAHNHRNLHLALVGVARVLKNPRSEGTFLVAQNPREIDYPRIRNRFPESRNDRLTKPEVTALRCTHTGWMRLKPEIDLRLQRSG